MKMTDFETLFRELRDRAVARWPAEMSDMTELTGAQDAEADRDAALIDALPNGARVEMNRRMAVARATWQADLDAVAEAMRRGEIDEATGDWIDQAVEPVEGGAV